MVILSLKKYVSLNKYIFAKKSLLTMRNLVIENLSKIYPNNVKALNNISIKISSGMFG